MQATANFAGSWSAQICSDFAWLQSSDPTVLHLPDPEVSMAPWNRFICTNIKRWQIILEKMFLNDCDRDSAAVSRPVAECALECNLCDRFVFSAQEVACFAHGQMSLLSNDVVVLSSS